jgi:hypothetical protein
VSVTDDVQLPKWVIKSAVAESPAAIAVGHRGKVRRASRAAEEVVTGGDHGLAAGRR